jgi:hypothetical protein
LLDAVGADYVEFSPSGLGLRSFVIGTLDKSFKGTSRGIKYEIYAEKRYLTVTGNRFRGSQIAAIFDFSAITPTPLAYVSSVPSVSSVSSVSSVNNGRVLRFEIPQSLVPSKQGERSDLLFELARYLKKHFSDAKPKDLKPIVQRWHEMALPFIGTKPFEDTWSEFCYKLRAVKYLDGEVARKVLENLPALSPEMNGAGEFGESGDHLLQIFLGLSGLTGDGVFFLPCRKAGKWLGRSHTDAARLIRAFVGLGVLEIVTPASVQYAARYRLVKLSQDRA